MHVICTGMSGADRRGYLRQVLELAHSRDKQLGMIDVKERMFSIAEQRGQPVEEETILDESMRALGALRAAALEQIVSEVKARASQQPNWILATHGVFRWKNTLIAGLDVFYLNQLEPDFYVTVTDGIKRIKTRLIREMRWRDISYSDILVWREEEQFVTEQMAGFHRKPHYLIAREESPDTLYKLIFWRDPNDPAASVKKIYMSFPITHVWELPQEDQELLWQQLRDFERRLRRHFIVFNPMNVNDYTELAQDSDGAIEKADTPLWGQEVERHIDDQIVARDYKLIEQSDMVVVFYQTPALSPGVNMEMKHGLENGKQVHVVWLPDTEPSPFLERQCTARQVFTSVEELFDYFIENRVLRYDFEAEDERVTEYGPNEQG